MHIIALFNKFSTFNGIKVFSLHFFIKLSRAKIPNAAPITENLSCIGSKSIEHLIKETKLICADKPVEVGFKHHSVLNKAQKAFLVKLNVVGKKVIYDACAAESRNSHYGVVDIALFTIKGEIGTRDLSAVGYSKNIYLVLA